jgi:UDP-3-O-[3-hydroxymyristoyl] glucosamine N-acyltransferase
MKLEQLKQIDPSIALIDGDPDSFEIVGISHSDAPQKNTFVFLKNKRFLNSLGAKLSSKEFPTAGLLIELVYWGELSDEIKDNLKVSFTWIATIQSVDEGMCLLSKPFHQKLFDDLNYFIDGRQMNEVSIDPSAQIAQGVFIGEGAIIGADVTIMAGAVIMPKVTIGDNSTVFPNVTIYPYTAIGKRVRVHAGTVIGTDGFGYNFFGGKHQKIWHLAGVQIKDDVEIGCNTMIDAGAFTPTHIGAGSKIDNDVQISHNVYIHEHVIVCGTTGIAGSVEINNYCAFGAGAGVGPGAKLEQGAQIAARAVVSANTIVKSGTTMAGHPARPLNEWMRSQATLRRLSKK